MQKDMLTAIRGDIKWRLSTYSDLEDEEADIPLDIGDISSYALDLTREIQANKKALTNKRRRPADEEEEVEAEERISHSFISTNSMEVDADPASFEDGSECG